jgi:hypothetical protein
MPKAVPSGASGVGTPKFNRRPFYSTSKLMEIE